MTDRPVDQLTLRELFTNSERLVRELVEHIERGFLPQVHNLRRITRLGRTAVDSERIEDVTVRNTVGRVLEGDDFTNQLYENLAAYLAAIDKSVHEIVTQG